MWGNDFTIVSHTQEIPRILINSSPLNSRSRYYMQRPLLRCYPVPFARRVAALMPHLLADGGPLISCPHDVDGRAIFSNMEFDDDCHDARIVDAIVYVRGSRKLQIPNHWREVLPLTL